MDENIPVYSIDLINKLNETYPPRSPKMHMTDREIWFEAGQRALVEILLQHINENDEDNQQDLPLILNQTDMRKE